MVHRLKSTLELFGKIWLSPAPKAQGKVVGHWGWLNQANKNP